jgi:tight adherence protein B
VSVVDVLFLLLIFAALLGTILSVWFAIMGGKAAARLIARASQARDRYIGKPLPEEAEALSLKRATKKSWIDDLAGHFLPNVEAWRKQIDRTGLNLSIGKLAVMALLISAIAGFGLSFIGLSWYIAWPAGIGMGLWSPRLLVNRLVKRRQFKFLAIFPDAVGLMVRGLRAGLPITETIMGVTREIGDPVGMEFRRIADQIQLGRPLEEALWEASQRIDNAEFTFMAIAFSIQRETGGNLAETLDNLDNILRRRRQLQLKIRTFSAEAKASATIIGSLPFVVLTILALVDFDYVAVLFNTSMGHMFLGSAMLCLAVGVGSMMKMGKFQV